ncbi:MAG: hypothetical protein K2N87_11830 [Eubacterium sp.]|nr:hypothetical protein [Eubacterium sp.]
MNMKFRNKKKSVQAAVVFVCLLLLTVTSAVSRQAVEREHKHPEFWKAVTYFSDEWVMNFWNSEMDTVGEDFQQILEDGFNSIIIAVPWREFQPQTKQVEYNDYAFEKLTWLMEQADKYGLDVIVRVGYAYDFYRDQEDSQIWQRYYAYFTDQQIQRAWAGYLEKLNGLLTKQKRYLGAFLTWEDWWGTVSYAQALGGKSEESRQMAQQMGYQDYLVEKYPVSALKQIFQDETITDREDLYIPSVSASAFTTFYDFYDELLIRLLADSQQVMPNLSMEVRSDQDLIYDEGGNEAYYSHKRTFDCQDSSFVSTVYGIPMGFENRGEKVTASQALEKTAYMLQSIHQETKRKDLFIDQFLFYDNTPKFRNNAQLQTGEINIYLKQAAKLLYEQTIGYGIWTYRDYHSNMIYNPQFALGTQGWTVAGDARLINDGSNKLELQKGSCLSQAVSGSRMHYPDEYVTVSFDVQLVNTSDAEITIQVGHSECNITLTKSERIVRKLKNTGDWNLSIATDADICIDNVKLYTHTQEGLVYDSNGKQQECLEGVRRMNALIDQYQKAEKEQEAQVEP